MIHLLKISSIPEIKANLKRFSITTKTGIGGFIFYSSCIN